jgi:Leucine-rich repeat (LRR) protein
MKRIISKKLAMKRLPILLLLLAAMLSCDSGNDPAPFTGDDDQGGSDDDGGTVELTQIADPAFEQALIDLGFDNVLDGSIRTSSAEGIVDLVINDKGISSLSGIEDFINLQNLWAQDNELAQVNLAQNTKLIFIFLDGNQLEDLEVVNLAELEKIGVSGNLLTTIDVSNNFNLELLDVSANTLEEIDVSANENLFQFSVVNNPLTCIKVSSNQLADIPEEWEKDEEDFYALKCQ